MVVADLINHMRLVGPHDLEHAPIASEEEASLLGWI